MKASQERMETLMSYLASQMYVNQEEIKVGQEEMKATVCAIQEKMEAEVDPSISTIQETMEAMINSIWSKIAETTWCGLEAKITDIIANFV
jgi:hypothetical protein